MEHSNTNELLKNGSQFGESLIFLKEKSTKTHLNLCQYVEITKLCGKDNYEAWMMVYGMERKGEKESEEES